MTHLIKALSHSRAIHTLGLQIIGHAPWNKALNLSSHKKTSLAVDSNWLFSALHTLLRNQEEELSNRKQASGITPFPPESVEALADWHCANDAVNEFARRTMQEGWEATQSFSWHALSAPRTLADQSSSIRSFFKRIALASRSQILAILARTQILLNVNGISCATISLHMLQDSKFFILGFNSRIKGLLPLESLFSIKVPQDLDAKLRQKFNAELKATLDQCKTPWKSEINDRVALFLSSAIPLTHLEGREKNLKAPEKILKRLKCRKILQATGLYFESPALFACGSAAGLGFEIIGIQHGGNYGYAACHSIALHVEGSVCDRFLTWGWSKWQNDVGLTTAIPVPIGSFYLRKLSKQIRRSNFSNLIKLKKKKRALYCSTEYLSRKLRLDFIPDINQALNAVLPKNIGVLIAFIKSTGFELSVKLPKNLSNAPLKNYVLKELDRHDCTTINISSDMRASDIVRDYDVVLWDTLCTGFLECLSLNIPTFLLPSAKENPPLVSGVSIAEEFFLEPATLDCFDIILRFSIAKKKSSEFIERFCASAPLSLKHWVAADSKP